MPTHDHSDLIVFDLSIVSALLIVMLGLRGTVATLAWIAALSLVVALARYENQHGTLPRAVAVRSR